MTPNETVLPSRCQGKCGNKVLTFKNTGNRLKMFPLNLVQWEFLPFPSYFTFYGDNLVVLWGLQACARGTGRAVSSHFTSDGSAAEGATASAPKGMGQCAAQMTSNSLLPSRSLY